MVVIYSWLALVSHVQCTCTSEMGSLAIQDMQVNWIWDLKKNGIARRKSIACTMLQIYKEGAQGN